MKLPTITVYTLLIDGRYRYDVTSHKPKIAKCLGMMKAREVLGYKPKSVKIIGQKLLQI